MAPRSASESWKRHCDHTNSCPVRLYGLSACVCVRALTSAAYAPSSDCSQCQISVSCAKSNYGGCVCVCLCVFPATRHIILPLMSRNMLFPADSISDTNTLSIPSSRSPSSSSFSFVDTLPTHARTSPFHLNRLTLNQLQNQVRERRRDFNESRT